MTTSVAIVMGSDSDLPIMREAMKVLEEFGVECEVEVSSAHRSPERTSEFAREAKGRGLQVIIAGAGSAAHLAGVIAAETTLPVIGVPIDSSPLKGFDSLLATVQMPPGVPVATMAVPVRQTLRCLPFRSWPRQTKAWPHEWLITKRSWPVVWPIRMHGFSRN